MKIPFKTMIEASFIISFIAELALALIIVSLLYESLIKPFHAKSFYRRLLHLIFLFPFYTKMISINFFIDIAILSVFILYGLVILIKTLRYKGRVLAIDEFEKRPLKPEYGLNDTIERIDKFIYMALSACIFALMSVFFGGEDINIFIGIVFLLIILIIMGNHIMNGHNKKSTKIDPKKIKVNLFTLMSLTLIFSLQILVILSFTCCNYFPTLLESFPFIVLIVTVPPLYVSNYLLDKSRLTFFRNEEIAKIFISNISKYYIICFIITIILSDIVVALNVLKGQNIVGMIIWVNGFIIFIANSLITIHKKSLLFGLESKTIKISNLKSETLK